MSWSCMTRGGPLLVFGSIGQGQIRTLNTVPFPHNNSTTYWHTVMILHTWVGHDPRRNSSSLGLGQGQIRTLNFAKFSHNNCIIFWPTMMILDVCDVCDPRINPIDFEVKTWKVWICCHGGYLSLLGQVSLYNECMQFPHQVYHAGHGMSDQKIILNIEIFVFFILSNQLYMWWPLL